MVNVGKYYTVRPMDPSWEGVAMIKSPLKETK